MRNNTILLVCSVLTDRAAEQGQSINQFTHSMYKKAVTDALGSQFLEDCGNPQGDGSNSVVTLDGKKVKVITCFTKGGNIIYVEKESNSKYYVWQKAA